MKNLIIGVLVVVLIALGIYIATKDSPEVVENNDQMADTMNDDSMSDDDSMMENKTETVIGQSGNGSDITAYHYGEGETEILLVGGIHGGYSWNTSLVAYEAMDYFKENEEGFGNDLRVTVIPVLNPDGLDRVLTTKEPGERFDEMDIALSSVSRTEGRFNANDVDLNRNFDCEWQESAVWQSRTVSGGDAPFSEPEARALRDYVEANSPDAVIVYYSAGGGVFASNCGDGVSVETAALTDRYAEAAGYQAFQEFDFYEVTGDAVNWLAKEGIPAISVLLTNHTDVEWNKNRAGIQAIIDYYRN